MRFNRDRPMPEAGFDITSMIDVVLLLTIFFMMSSQFSRVSQKALDLPRQAGDANPRSESESDAAVVIDLEQDGRLSVAGRRYELARLVTLVAADRARSEKSGNILDVVVRADRLTPASQLTRLAAALGAEGVINWRLATTGERAIRNLPGGAGVQGGSGGEGVGSP